MRPGRTSEMAPRTAESLAIEFGAAYRARTTRSEILMGDFYGGRPTILKFMPWWGRVLEAGCGLGRYVFYLRRLGHDAIGVEVSAEALEECRRAARRVGVDPALFRQGDVRSLDLPADTLSAYLSLGVVEHFEEGPGKAFEEAHRLLAPGGVAVICTPSRWSVEHLFDIARCSARRHFKSVLAPLGLARPCLPRPFDQYWFGCGQLAGFARRAGFTVTQRVSVDLKYAVHETLNLIGRAPGPAARASLFRAMDMLEATPLRRFGALSFIVAVKDGDRRCFFCGETGVPGGRLTWTVPVCFVCSYNSPPDILREYAPGTPATFASRERPGEAGQPLAGPGPARCWNCEELFEPDPDFGLLGLDRPICPGCIARPVLRGWMVLHALREQWRPRL